MYGFYFILVFGLGFDNFNICIMKYTQNALMTCMLEAFKILTKLGMNPFVNIVTCTN